MSLINQVLQDLEKRHASESELNTLPPYVRAVRERPQPAIRVYVLAAVVTAVVIAIVAYLYGSAHAPGPEVPQIAAKPAAVPTAGPVPEPTPAVTASAEAPTQKSAFSPVSRLSDELSLVAPLSAPKKRLEGTAPHSSPAAVTAMGAEVAAPRPEKTQVPLVNRPSRSELPSKAGGVSPAPLAPVTAAVTPPSTMAAGNDTPGAIDKQMREVAPSERAEIAFRKGVAQIREGRANAAELDFRDALKQDPTHAGARQALLGLLLDSGRNNDAEQLLREALTINPHQPRHAMVLARLEVDRGDVTGAVNTMVGALPYVQSDPDFFAFLAALLQREGRHREAVDYYRTALRDVPGNGVWMMGLGISLRASNQAAEAREAFQRALDSSQLSPALQEFVRRQLRELSAAKKK
jgi:MSHA biogenesis protein MshN